jgi:hypothetical protein
MSENKHSEAHKDFAAEEARNENILVGISRTIDKLPFKHTADLDRRTVVSAVAKKFIEAGNQVSVSDRGWVLMTDKSGAQVDLSEAVQEALLTDKTLVDQESVSAAVASGALGVQAKSDLRTIPQKIAYVNKFGEAAFAKLPMTRQPKVTDDLGSMTGREYLTLPRSRKVEIVGMVGEKGVSEILKRK